MPAYWPRPLAHRDVHPFGQTLTAAATARLLHRPGLYLYRFHLSLLHRVVELLAHELEHIIERLEGIHVRQLPCRVPHLVWSTADGRDQTRRAIYSGQTVASEVGDGPEVISAEEAKTY